MFISNYRVLAGRTLFITGASRGIGKAIAIKAAKDGANIVIAAKTAEPHSKLPGTVYTAAKEGICNVMYTYKCLRYVIFGFSWLDFWGLPSFVDFIFEDVLQCFYLICVLDHVTLHSERYSL